MGLRRTELVMADLGAMEFTETSYPGVSVRFLASDRATGYAAVLIRMEPGSSYPRHAHTGGEELLVLRGGYEDEAGRYGAGEFRRHPPGSRHHPRVPEDGETCSLFAIAREGIEILDEPEQRSR